MRGVKFYTPGRDRFAWARVGLSPSDWMLGFHVDRYSAHIDLGPFGFGVCWDCPF